MPLRLPDRLPAIDLLKQENIFVMDDTRAHSQDIRPLRIAILNLMPLKITTETDLIRLLSNTPLQLDVSFMKLKSHTPKNTPIEHMMMFYRDFAEMRQEKYDGMTDMIWKSEDESIAKVDYKTGLVTPVAPGTVKITAYTDTKDVRQGDYIMITVVGKSLSVIDDGLDQSEAD